MTSAPSPPAILFDFALPDSLLRAREAALLPLRPALKARERGLNETQAQVLRLLVRMGEPVAVPDIERRCTISRMVVYGVAHHLVAHGYAEWTAPVRARNNQMQRKLIARDIGRRQINHIARDASRNGAPDWEALASRPAEARLTEPMHKRMFILLTRLQRASQRESVLDGANEPDIAGEDAIFGLALRLRLARAALIKRIRPSLTKYDFTEPQWRILRIIASQPGLGWSAGALFRRGCFHFSSPDVSRTLFYLSQRGLIQKHGEGERPKDWRLKSNAPQKRWKAEINRTGRDIIRRVETHLEKECADLFERLEAREMEQLDRLLDRLTYALLWRDDVPEDEQDVHPFAEQYRRFDAEVYRSARAFTRESRQLREAGLPVPKRRITHWWA